MAATPNELLDLLLANQAPSQELFGVDPGGTSDIPQLPGDPLSELQRILAQREEVQPEKIPFAKRGLAGLGDALAAFAAVKSGGQPPSVTSLDKLRGRRQADVTRKRQDLLLRAGQEEKREARDFGATEREITRQQGLEAEDRKFGREQQLITQQGDQAVLDRAGDLGIDTEGRDIADLRQDISAVSTIKGMRSKLLDIGVIPPRTGTLQDLERLLADRNKEITDFKITPKAEKIDFRDRQIQRETLQAITEDAFGTPGIEGSSLKERLESGQISPEDAKQRIVLGIENAALPGNLKEAAIQRYQQLILPIIEEFQQAQQAPAAEPRTFGQLATQSPFQPLVEGVGAGIGGLSNITDILRAIGIAGPSTEELLQPTSPRSLPGDSLRPR